MNNSVFPVYVIPPGSTLQISLTVLTITVSLFAGAFLGIKKKYRKEKVLLAAGLLLAASEIIKELYMYCIYGCYQWSDFPFQLCSIPMYLCIINYFRHRLYFENFIMVYSLIGAAASFCVPSAVFSRYIVLTMHSLFWHGGLFCIGVFLVIRQKKEDLRIKDFIPVGILYICLSSAAVILNAVFASVSEGRMNMFFLGPNYPDMLILNDIHVNSGWAAATLGMIGTSLAAGFAVYLLIICFKFKIIPAARNKTEA